QAHAQHKTIRLSMTFLTRSLQPSQAKRSTMQKRPAPPASALPFLAYGRAPGRPQYLFDRIRQHPCKAKSARDPEIATALRRRRPPRPPQPQSRPDVARGLAAGAEKNAVAPFRILRDLRER